MVPSLYDRNLESIKIYRDFAKYYFSMRSNLTYVNLLGSGGTLVLFAKALLDSPRAWQATLSDDFLLYVFGAVAIVIIGTWATAISCCLSNSIQAYLQMSKELEISSLYADYASFCMRDGIEFEFATHPQDISGRVLNGIAWNGLNASVIVLALLLLGFIALEARIYWLAFPAICLSAIVFILVMFFMLRKISDPPYWETNRRNNIAAS
jgi:hypothetical protein